MQNKRRSEEGTSEGPNGKKVKTATYEDYAEENEIENDVNVEEDLLFLRNAVMPNQTDEIKFKLRSTLKRRIELTSNKPSVHLRSNFPFFFSDPSLVSSWNDRAIKELLNGIFVSDLIRLQFALFAV